MVRRQRVWLTDYKVYWFITMEQDNYKYLSIGKSNLKWNGDLELLKCFIAEDLGLSGKWSSPGGEVKAFTNENETSAEKYIVKIKWYQDKKKLLFQGSEAKQVEEAIYNTIKQTSSSPKREMCSRFENSNLHNNDKHCEPYNDLKLEMQKLNDAIEQNKTCIDNLDSKCKAPQSSSDTTRLDLYKLRNEYETICSENANLRKENTEYLTCMNGLASTIADLSIKIKTLDEEKASLEASVRLLNEDNRQLILKTDNLGCNHDCEKNLAEITKTRHHKNTSMPGVNTIESIDLDNASQELNGQIN